LCTYFSRHNDYRQSTLPTSLTRANIVTFVPSNSEVNSAAQREVKLTLEQATKAQRGSRCKALFFL